MRGITRSMAVATICAATLVACAPTSISPGGSSSVSVSSSASSTSTPTFEPAGPTCATITGHLYEACFAYIFNDASWSLQPYYKYVHSNSAFAFLKNRLELKYRGQALQTIQQRTARWPSGTNTVEGPDITILKGWSSLTCNKAVLITRETWKVLTPTGRVLYQEYNQAHTVVLRRVPDERFRVGSHVLHQWVVQAIYSSEGAVQPQC